MTVLEVKGNIAAGETREDRLNTLLRNMEAMHFAINEECTSYAAIYCLLDGTMKLGMSRHDSILKQWGDEHAGELAGYEIFKLETRQ